MVFSEWGKQFYKRLRNISVMNIDLTKGYYTELANRTHDLIVEKAMNENLDKLLQDKNKEIERLKKLLDDNNIDYEDKGDEISFSPVKDGQVESVE